MPAASGIVDRLEDAFARFETQPALHIHGRATLTFGELARLARRVELHLQAYRQGLVAVWCDRSPISFAALLACFLTGRPWIALAPLFPDRRIASLLASLPVGSVLIPAGALATRPALADAAPSETRVVALDEEGGGMPKAGNARARPPNLDLPAGTCCLYGTSGSAGTPKYVPLTQTNVGTFLDALQHRFDIGPERRLSLLHELSSSASLQNLLLGLCGGATLCLPANGNVLALGAFLRDSHVDFVHLVPSTVRTLARLGQLKPGSLPDVAETLIGGEIVRRPVVQSWSAAAARAVLYNSYGPTEATVNIAIATCPSSDEWVDDIAPVGSVFAGHKAALVDIDERSAAGELVLAGPQIAPGYLGRDAETAERFVRLPQLDGGSAIWYRTGDRARFETASGCWTVIGRVDRELKVAGYRVDPAEIEAALRLAAPEASEVALVAVRDGDGVVERLVGFVENLGTAPATVIGTCRATLPHYMVPSAVIGLSSLPTGSNGKTDYDALLRLYRTAG